MTDQAQDAIDPMQTAIDLIANSQDESDDLEEDQEDELPGSEGEEPKDAPEEEGATEAPKPVVEFAGQKFEIPEGTPPELVGKVQEIGKNLQADYTRKTQDLVSREQQAATLVQRDLDQGRQHVANAIQQAQAVVQAIGGFMDPAQLAQLAEQDPGEWARQSARQNQLAQYMGQLQQHQQALAEQAKQAQDQAQEAAKQQAWQRLNDEGVTREALQKTWSDAKTAFPFLTDEKLSQVLDAESWLVLRDAVAYRQLKAGKPEITKKIADAPKLPQGKQPMTKEVRDMLDARKAVSRKGGASMRDLAAFISANTR